MGTGEHSSVTRRVPVPLEKTDEGGKSWRAGLGRKTLSSDFNVLNLSYLVVITLNSPGQKKFPSEKS